MHSVAELPPWERMLKSLVWAQLGEITGKQILDFGSGEGITANHFADRNTVVAIEPDEKMRQNRWADHTYTQIAGDVSTLSAIKRESFDMILCHNVLEYIDDKAQTVSALCRLLKPGGTLSLVKHNRAGRVMQMAVLLDDAEQAHALLDGKDSVSARFGAIRYYEDEQIAQWERRLQLIDLWGIRAFWHLQQKQERHAAEDWQAQMTRLEMRVSKIEEYRNIAFFHHLLFVKKE